MVVLIDPKAALRRLETVMFTLQEICHRGQRLPMAMGFLAQSVRSALESSEDPQMRRYDQYGRAAVLRQMSEIYETSMGHPNPEEEL
jgi:hypothetical protein